MIGHAGPKKLEFGRALRRLAINRKIPPDPAFTNPLTSYVRAHRASVTRTFAASACADEFDRQPNQTDKQTTATRMTLNRGFCYDARVNFGGEAMIMRHLRTRMKTMITKEQFDAIIKAVNEGGDDDDEITEDEVIAILRDTGLDTEIPYFQELFAWERSRNRPQ